jgi:hypothetical protein
MTILIASWAPYVINLFAHVGASLGRLGSQMPAKLPTRLIKVPQETPKTLSKLKV